MRCCDDRRHDALGGIIRSGPLVFVTANSLGRLGVSESLLNHNNRMCLKLETGDTATVDFIVCIASQATSKNFNSKDHHAEKHRSI